MIWEAPLAVVLIEAVKELKRQQDGELAALKTENQQLRTRLERLELLLTK